MDQLKYHRPSKADVDSINHLISDAKRSWGYDEDLMSLWLPDLLVDETILSSREFWLARSDDTLVGVYSVSVCTERAQEPVELTPLELVGVGEYWELEDFWILPQAMGQGVGRAMFSHMIENLVAKKAKRLRIVADPNARVFYEKMGARYICDQASKPEGRVIPVLALALASEPL